MHEIFDKPPWQLDPIGWQPPAIGFDLLSARPVRGQRRGRREARARRAPAREEVQRAIADYCAVQPNANTIQICSSFRRPSAESILTGVPTPSLHVDASNRRRSSSITAIADDAIYAEEPIRPAPERNASMTREPGAQAVRRFRNESAARHRSRYSRRARQSSSTRTPSAVVLDERRHAGGGHDSPHRRRWPAVAVRTIATRADQQASLNDR